MNNEFIQKLQSAVENRLLNGLTSHEDHIDFAEVQRGIDCLTILDVKLRNSQSQQERVEAYALKQEVAKIAQEIR